MTREEISNLSNADLNIRLKTLENEYEAEKKKAQDVIDRMESLNKEYSIVKNEISKRNSSIWKREM